MLHGDVGGSTRAHARLNQGLIGWAILSRRGGIGNREVEHDDGWQPEEGALPLGIFLALAGLEVMLIGEGLTDLYLETIRSLL